ncbi:hypothetical protein HDIA_4532 [Hartmannibacter diazotrophicus]|uniref:O-methyltransferase n=1 Tax=Hartmannibacter diazotrophicus TaxID=1482074 RepID=A0A2C9DCW1_9HYPH|nr:class I SAM-dependent methyltransferase [Hartmannibacter diazotrophicus]SON58073.1 hypothetical protein HDIA_4532 [Hartmannibacter diazotrophicus]
MSSTISDKVLKFPYVSLVHALRDLSGVARNETEGKTVDRSRTGLWLRSLLAIYDIDDMNRLDLAWWQLDALAEADRFLAARPQARVFEYGSGASTLWLARRAASVTSVEHDGAWHRRVSGMLGSYPHVTLLHVPGAIVGEATSAYGSGKGNAAGLDFRDYAHAIDGQGRFDMIVIDGRCRERCLDLARRHLAPGGIILFDNSNRRRYQKALANCGLAAKRYAGLTACLPYPDETTILSAP